MKIKEKEVGSSLFDYSYSYGNGMDFSFGMWKKAGSFKNTYANRQHFPQHRRSDADALARQTGKYTTRS
jgi:hypothetical protein